MPVMMPCAMRVGSMDHARPGDRAETSAISYTVTSISRLEARQTSACVRKPAGAAAVAALQPDEAAGDQRGDAGGRRSRNTPAPCGRV